LIVDLNEYVNDPTWGLTAEEQADFYPVFWEQDVLGGKRLGIPAERSAQVLYYNQTWAEELGFDEPPTTPEEFNRQACAASEANRQDDLPDNDLTGGWMVTTEYAAMTGWMYAFGGEITPPGGSGYRFDTPEIEETFQFLRSLFDQGCAWIPESDPPETEFADRSGLFTAGSVAGIPHQSQVFERAENRDEWTVLPFPSPQEKPAISVYGPSFEILKSQPERQLAAWVLLKWLTLPENQAQLVQASGSFPVRRSTQEHLDSYAGRYPQWAAAQALIQYAHPEPAFQSWSTVRWAVSDASTQLFRYYFTIDQVSSLIKLLDETAKELDARE
jgi:multiple sugar transport system substrate-binding protein/sn-glycerol 3-phosphate transport system substrate-binding protein